MARKKGIDAADLNKIAGGLKKGSVKTPYGGERTSATKLHEVVSGRKPKKGEWDGERYKAESALGMNDFPSLPKPARKSPKSAPKAPAKAEKVAVTRTAKPATKAKPTVKAKAQTLQVKPTRNVKAADPLQPKKGPGRPPKPKVDEVKRSQGRPKSATSRRSLREKKKAETLERAKKAGIADYKIKPGRAPSFKPKPDKPIVAEGKLEKNIQPSDLKEAKQIHGYRGKTHVEVRKYGGSIVKLQTRKGESGGQSYEVTRNLQAKPGDTKFKPATVHVLSKGPNGEGYVYRVHKENRKLDETQGQITKNGKTAEFYKPNRGAANYGSASFWHGLSGSKPIITEQPPLGKQERSVGRLSARHLDEQKKGKGRAHKGGHYITVKKTGK